MKRTDFDHLERLQSMWCPTVKGMGEMRRVLLAAERYYQFRRQFVFRNVIRLDQRKMFKVTRMV